MPFVVKAPVSDPQAKTFSFAQKVMYGGKSIAAGEEIFIFASENEGGRGLVARGVVTSVEPIPVKRARAKIRQTPRMSIAVKHTGFARRALGREELKAFRSIEDDRPQSEIAWKLYRQATNKIAGISDRAAAFLRTFF